MNANAPEDDRNDWRGLAATLVVTAIVALAVSKGFAIPALGPADPMPAFVEPSLRPWAIFALAYVALVALAIRGGLRRGELSRWLRPRSGDLAVAVATGAISFAVAFAGQKLLTPSGVGNPREAWLVRMYLVLGDPLQMRAHLPSVAAAILAFALAEELVWRGYVQSILVARFGVKPGVALAAVLYAVAHLPALWLFADGDVGLNPLLPLAALACGLIWGTAAQMSGGRLFAVIVAHALFDWCVAVQYRLWGPSV